MCYERNLTPRSEMLVSQSKLKRTLTFDSVLLTKVQSISMEDFSYFFLLKKRKSVYSSFQREIPCSRQLTVFFRQKTPLLTKVQSISMQDVAQIGFFFYKEKILFTARSNGKFPAADLERARHLLS